MTRDDEIAVMIAVRGRVKRFSIADVLWSARRLRDMKHERAGSATHMQRNAS